MLPSLFPLVTLLSYFTLVSSIAIEGRSSWRLSHGLPPARPRRLHSSATETAHRRSASPTPPVVNGGDFEQSSLTSPWAKSSGLAITLYGFPSPEFGHTGSGVGRIYGSTTSTQALTSSITGLSPNNVYTLSYWMKVIVNGYATCTVSALVDGIPVPGASQLFGESVPYNTWIQVTGQFTATAATESIVLQNDCTNSTLSFNVVNVDDVTAAIA
ncbi:hypothetical protein DL96DRAFT_1088135 [Flagelloscypha sp. PMI_526]|nr:hypothetical protein DL96DRAFT_1088135 [Flagelloscypha sp. PMI_526]